jgi:hypothetical protein
MWLWCLDSVWWGVVCSEHLESWSHSRVVERPFWPSTVCTLFKVIFLGGDPILGVAFGSRVITGDKLW